VLLAADGVSNTEIAWRVGFRADGDRIAGTRWQLGYRRAERSAALRAPHTLDHAAIVTATLKPPPAKLCVSH
jgi:hypothetical protein